GPHVRHAGDQPFRLEDLQRLAHRNDADAKACRQIIDDEPFSRLQLAGKNRPAERLVSEPLFGLMSRAGWVGQKWHIVSWSAFAAAGLPRRQAAVGCRFVGRPVSIDDYRLHVRFRLSSVLRQPFAGRLAWPPRTAYDI